jgi:hypothetical protein
MLTPRQENGEQNNQQKLNVLYGIISGYDIAHKHSANDAVVSNKVLILLEEDKDKGDNEVKRSPGIAFWSTIVDNSDGTTSLTDIIPTLPPSSILCSMYYIEMHEFHQGSEAYSACSSIIAYLKNQSKIGPFLQPVDHIALGLFDYLNVVKTPMVRFFEIPCCKISWLCTASNSHCNLLPPDLFLSRTYQHWRKISMMVNIAVFAVVLMPMMWMRMMGLTIQFTRWYTESSTMPSCLFLMYNSEASWIGGEATVLKKNLAKNIQQVVSKAVWQGRGQRG